MQVIPPAGRVLRIVEHKDASPDELEVRECNTGILCADTARLRVWLDRIRDDNAQGEYYLTDIVALAVADGACGFVLAWVLGIVLSSLASCGCCVSRAETTST